MEIKPLVSIIIPTYNRSELLKETLESISIQTYPFWECLIIDDGSTDNTEETVKQFMKKDERFQYYKRPKFLPKGANACRNYGLEVSKGSYIQWFDSDDLLLPNKLQLQVFDLIKANASVCLCNFRMFQGPKDNFDNMSANLSSTGISTYYNYISGLSILNMQIALFKKEDIESIKFDINLSRAQDLDFMYKVLKELKEKTIICNQILCLIRKHGDSITSNYRKGGKKELYSEITVRERIFFENINEEISQEIKNKILHRTLYSYRGLLVHGFINEYISKMTFIGNNLGVKRKLRLFILVLIGLFYGLTKRGIYVYGIYLNKV